MSVYSLTIKWWIIAFYIHDCSKWWCIIHARSVTALAASVPKKAFRRPKASSSAIQQPLIAELQRCITLEDVVNRLGPHIDAALPNGELCSLILVRLSKQLMAMENQNMIAIETSKDWMMSNLQDNLASVTGNIGLARHSFPQFMSRVILGVTSIDWSNLNRMDALVDGTKACAVIARVLSSYDSDLTERRIIDPWMQFWNQQGASLVLRMEAYHLSGLVWAWDSFVAASSGERRNMACPKTILDVYNAMHIPFRILPNSLYCSNITSVERVTVSSITSEVEFHMDEIRATGSEDSVAERRLTAWQGDVGVASFAYSGKSMPRKDWAPTIRRIRDHLALTTGQYYDGCLLNLYPDGRSGMRYHQDPDQGTLWDFDTAVVSIGAARRFSFRSLPPTAIHASKMPSDSKPHNFVVMDGDVTYMFGDCQQKYQHAVKNAEPKHEAAPRISLVFKRTWTNC